MIGKLRMCQSIEEAFQGVQLDELVGRSPGAFRQALQVEVTLARQGILGSAFHNTISKALRTGSNHRPNRQSGRCTLE
jgi:hypothetical protein